MKRTWMLGMAVLAGALSMGAARANAAQVGVYVGVQPAYAYEQPPCPGPGYTWVAGYWNAGRWFPGRWNYIAVRSGYDRFDGPRDRYYAVDRNRGWDRDRHDYRDDRYDRDRHGDRR